MVHLLPQKEGLTEVFMTDDENLNMDVMNVEEAAVYLKFSRAYLYRLAKENRIPHIAFGRHVFFRKIDLFNWLGSKITYQAEDDF